MKLEQSTYQAKMQRKDSESIVISWEESLHDYNNTYKKVLEEKEWSKSISPIITTYDNNQKRLCSCLLISCRNYYFILTALHCLEFNAHQRINLWNKASIDLTDIEWHCSSNENLDFAFSRIERPQKFNLKHEHFLEISLTALKSQSSRNAYYAALGYPNKTNELFERKKGIDRHVFFVVNSNKQTTDAMNTHASSEIKFDSSSHIAVDFSLNKRFYTPDGDLIERLFTPKGMSGGPLIYINNIEDCANGEPARLSLAGIIIALKQKIRVENQVKDILVVTRTGTILKSINEYIDSLYKD